MRLKLVVIGGKKAGMEIPISTSTYLIGRGEECQLRAPSPQISRKHCTILIDNGSAIIEDCGSANGTLVNGLKIQQRHEIKNEDRIKIGPLEVEVRLVNGQAIVKKPPIKVTANRPRTRPANPLDTLAWPHGNRKGTEKGSLGAGTFAAKLAVPVDEDAKASVIPRPTSSVATARQRNGAQWSECDLLLAAAFGIMTVAFLSWCYPLSWPKGISGPLEFFAWCFRYATVRWLAILLVVATLFPKLRAVARNYPKLDETSTALLAAVGLLLITLPNFQQLFWYRRGLAFWFSRGIALLLFCGLSVVLVKRFHRRHQITLRSVTLALLLRGGLPLALDLVLLYLIWGWRGGYVILLTASASLLYGRVTTKEPDRWGDLNLLLLGQAGFLVFYVVKLLSLASFGWWYDTVALLVLLSILFVIRVYRTRKVNLDEITLIFLLQIGFLVKFLFFRSYGF